MTIELRRTVVDLIAEFGAPADFSVSRASVPVYDPVTGDSSTTLITGAGKGVLLGYATRDIDGERVRVDDRRLFMRHDVDLEPQPGDKVTVSGVTYAVLAVRRYEMAGVLCGFTCQVRS